MLSIVRSNNKSQKVTKGYKYVTNLLPASLCPVTRASIKPSKTIANSIPTTPLPLGTQPSNKISDQQLATLLRSYHALPESNCPIVTPAREERGTMYFNLRMQAFNKIPEQFAPQIKSLRTSQAIPIVAPNNSQPKVKIVQKTTCLSTAVVVLSTRPTQTQAPRAGKHAIAIKAPEEGQSRIEKTLPSPAAPRTLWPRYHAIPIVSPDAARSISRQTHPSKISTNPIAQSWTFRPRPNAIPIVSPDAVPLPTARLLKLSTKPDTLAARTWDPSRPRLHAIPIVSPSEV